MNILFIQSDKPYFEDVLTAADSKGHTICLLPPLPDNSESSKESYLKDVISCVKDIQADCIFTLDFDPFLSLAAMVIGISYKAWLVSPYSPLFFDASIRNECNDIFVADSALCETLRDLGVQKCSFLPLAIPYRQGNKATPAESTVDISLFGEIKTRESLPDNPCLTTGPLLDSTKGYLEGCIACKYQLADTNLAYDKLPDYIQNDLTKHYSTPDTLETLGHFLEANYFHPMVTWSERKNFFSAVVAQSRFSKINVFSPNDGASGEAMPNKELFYYDRVDYHDALPEFLHAGKIALVIPSRNRIAGISPVLWNAFGEKVLCVTPVRADLSGIRGVEELTYRTEEEMLSKLAYYSAHDKEREEITNTIYEDVCARHTFAIRIDTLFS